MFIDSAKLLLRFQTSSFYEEVSQTYMAPQGTNISAQILDGGGYAMRDDQYLLGEGLALAGYPMDISNAFTLGFWLYPVNPGLVPHEDTGDPFSVTMPLLNFNDTSSANVSIIKLTETTTSDGYNYLTVLFNNEVYSGSSEDYAPGMWHYFWITYNGSALYIYIDGKLQILQRVSGSLPATINGSSLDLYINHSLDGYAYNVAKNYGYISDIFVLNVTDRNEADIQRAINDGIIYVVNDTYTDTYIEKFSIYFNNPDTITVTTSIDDMSYVYLGRNDGKILRGSPLLWENRRIFSDPNEEDVLDLSVGDSSIENGFLELRNKTIRL